MTNQNAHIFVDEFGNSALNVDKAGTFSHFVYCSVIISEKDSEKAEDVRMKLCKKFRLGPDIKSRNIKEKDFEKRLQILKYLTESLDFTIDVLVIDKAKIQDAPGLKFKQIFYKYFQNLFVKKYSEKYESFSIWADRIGEEFALELQNYVRKESVSPTLFHPDRLFFLADDITKQKRIQLADLIAGSLGKVFCTSHSHKRGQEIYDILHTRTSVEFFPFFTSSSDVRSVHANKHDKEIVEITLRTVADHIEIIKQKDHNEEVGLLSFLLLNFKINSSRLVPTHEITAYLGNFFLNVSDEKVRGWVRNLRYDGIFVISHPGKPGYKLANSYYDITQQFEHYLKYVLPMLRKVKILNSSLASETFNEVNILEQDKTFKELRQMLTGVK